MAAAAVLTVMEVVLRAVLVKEAKDIFTEEWVDMPGVGSEVAVVYVEVAVVYLEVTVELEVVEVTLVEMVELMKSFPVGEGVDLLIMGQISKMNVVLITLKMVE